MKPKVQIFFWRLKNAVLGKVGKFKAGPLLKSDWTKMPGEFFEPLTFGEFKVGQKFISLPSPGDNDGHRGFRGAHYIFTKTHEVVTEAAPGLPYGIPHGRAVNDHRNIPSDCPHSMFVILVE